MVIEFGLTWMPYTCMMKNKIKHTCYVDTAAKESEITETDLSNPNFLSLK